MKNAVLYQNCWLMPNSHAFELFKEWKKQTSPKLELSAKKALEEHMAVVNNNYRKLSGISV